MVKGKEIIDITKEYILSKISHFDIFHMYIPKLKLNNAFCSPFEKDTHPSVCVKMSKDTGIPYFTNFSKNYTLNSFQYVGKIFGLDYNQTLRKIASDFGIVGNIRNTQDIVKKYEQPRVEKEYRKFDVFARPFNHDEIEYWNKRYLSEEKVKKGNIYGYDRIFMDGKKIVRTNLLSFAYYYPSIDRFKIYTPFALKPKKWFTNVPLQHIEGLSNLKKDKICIGAKSRKDNLIISLFIPEVFECQNESESTISEKNIKYIKENSKRCYLYFDPDPTGVKSCTYYNQFGLDYVNNSKECEAKDADEYIIRYKPEGFEQFLKEKNLI